MKSQSPQERPDPRSETSPPTVWSWLVRIPEVLEPAAPEVLHHFGAQSVTRLGHDYYLIKTPAPEKIQQSDAAKFVRWNLPVEHSWPCNPQKMEGFIEKAAQTLVKKFAGRHPQTLLVGQLNPGSPDRYYKSLASNLRGRALQLFIGMKSVPVEEQDSNALTLFCMVGREGLFAGMQSPKKCNGLYAGGSKYISSDSPDTISRAGAKIAEALHYLLMHRSPLPPGSHWLELGASPGGMTSELLARGYKVTAIDRASLDKRLDGHPNLTFVRDDVTFFQPGSGSVYHAILTDMNGEPEASMAQVIRLSRYLKKGGLVVFTLKVPKVVSVENPQRIFNSIVHEAEQAGLRLFAETHLTYNRHEFTLFFESTRQPELLGSQWWQQKK